MRLIDADELLDHVIDIHCKNCERRKGVKNGKYRIIYEVGDVPCRSCGVDDMKSYLEDAPTIEPQQWIPVTEGLPEDGAEVWVTTDMLSEVTRARWHKDSNLWCHPYNSDCLLALRPIAWMEISLPKPYKGDTK